MSRHINIPVFIPHLGCPNNCVFCNQRSISGVQEFDPERLVDIIEDSLSTTEPDDEIEIAFFGGSFTGIDYQLMISLLEIAYSYIKIGKVKSIRCSTRPDYIDKDILTTLKKYGVKVIELGLQSSSEKVLRASKRGHSLADEERACKMIVDAGFTLVGQMMIGLPDADEESELKTADFIISVGASAARIYPTVVFHDTELCAMAESGDYMPLSLDEAVRRSASVYNKFIDAGVKVIRIGLCSSENLASGKTYHAGPNHPAIGELVENELFYNKIYNGASRLALCSSSILRVSVSNGHLSKAIGQKKRNKLLLIKNLGISDVKFVENSELSGYEILVMAEEGEKKCI